MRQIWRNKEKNWQTPLNARNIAVHVLYATKLLFNYYLYWKYPKKD